jgi:hypothetical protein
MTVTDLIKKLQQHQAETIVSVRIEFGDGSIYNSPIARRVSPRPAVANPRAKLSGQSKQRTAD